MNWGSAGIYRRVSEPPRTEEFLQKTTDSTRGPGGTAERKVRDRVGGTERRVGSLEGSNRRPFR